MVCRVVGVGGLGMSVAKRESDTDYLRPVELLGIMSRALRQRWPVDPEKKAGMVKRLEEISENTFGNASVKEQLAATKLLKEMDDANFRAMLDVGDLAHKVEKFETLANMEKSLSRSFSDGPTIELEIVSDEPMAAIEHTGGENVVSDKMREDEGIDR